MENLKETASVTDAITQAVSDYFAKPDSKDIVYSTSDGNLFEILRFATNHGSTLEDKEATPHKKPNNIEVVDHEDLTDSAIELNPEQTELLNTGLVVQNYNKLKQLVSVLKIETADQKAETVIKVLEDYKAKNQK